MSMGFALIEWHTDPVEAILLHPPREVVQIAASRIAVSALCVAEKQAQPDGHVDKMFCRALSAVPTMRLPLITKDIVAKSFSQRVVVHVYDGTAEMISVVASMAAEPTLEHWTSTALRLVHQQGEPTHDRLHNPTERP